MAMENFQIVELLGLVLHNPNGTLAGTIDYMDGLTIDNSSSKQELRSGPGNSVLYSVSSEFQSSLSGDCVMSTDLFKVLTSTQPVEGSHKFMLNEIIQASGTTVVLPEVPAAGGKIHVFPLDGVGKRLGELKVGTPTSNEADYSIQTKNITVHSKMSGKKFKVIYEVEKEGTRFRKEAKDSSIYRVVGMAKAVDLATKEKKIGQFIIPSFKPEVAFSIGTSNGEMTKAAIAGECLLDPSTNSSWDFIAEA
ncbi:MAG: hypothetical protein RSA51_07265 [Niameybacter sp.]